MPEFSKDYFNGYLKAKEENEEQLNKAYDKLTKYEREYIILSESARKNAVFIQENERYIELGKALMTILDYMKEGKNDY